MNTTQVYSSNKFNDSIYNVRVNLTEIAMVLFVLYFTLLKSFLLSPELEIVLLVFAMTLLLFNRLIVNNNGIIMFNVDFSWILFLMYFVMQIGFNNLITGRILIDIIVYSSGILFLIFVKVDIDHFDKPLKVVKILGIIYACSAIFQYLFPDIYFNYVLPLFSQNDQLIIMRLFNSYTYTGFTNQTAHLAGYIVSGIGILVFSKNEKNFTNKVLSFVSLALLFIGLFLSGKRAHLFFGVVSLGITALLSVTNKKLINNILKPIISTIVILILIIILYNNIDVNNLSDSPFVTFFNRIESTIIGLLQGEDVTTGRSRLYTHAWGLFNDNIMFGIGWREFFSNSLGLINPITSTQASHPHNIYLQLLTEKGLIGFTLFIIPVLSIYYKTFRMLRYLSLKDNFQKWKTGIKFSFFSQTFFLLYGLTGNLLTDHNFLLTYFFVCSISLSAMLFLNPKDKENINQSDGIFSAIK